jgi:bifunctional UDP-N-acetylglucosamine pyrophosphorylase/glucosamine-1-phosphate N-acetyltransferase
VKFELAQISPDFCFSNKIRMKMQAVIMAAGKGTRLRPLTETIPKALIDVNGQTILEYTLSALPEKISEVIIVIGYKGEKIREKFGDNFGRLKLRYIIQNGISGTAGALWSTKELLRKEKFLVLNGDDLYEKFDLEKCLEKELTLAVYFYKASNISSFNAVEESNGFFTGLYQPTAWQLQKGIFIVTGAYVLDERIFNYEPVQLESGEYGLPQTIAKMAKDHPVKLVKMNFWLPINSLKDLKRAEEVLLDRAQ